MKAVGRMFNDISTAGRSLSAYLCLLDGNAETGEDGNKFEILRLERNGEMSANAGSLE